jgi:hypothetical protein
VDKAQQEAEAALKAWDEELTQETGKPGAKTGTPTGASTPTGSTGQQGSQEAAEAQRKREEAKIETEAKVSSGGGTLP